jgi:hypothetical protein
MKAGALFPGQAVATDNYQTCIHGRRPWFPRGHPALNNVPGWDLFVDICSGKVWAYHEVALSASDTIRSKDELRARLSYLWSRRPGLPPHGDNGIFNFAEFI